MIRRTAVMMRWRVGAEGAACGMACILPSRVDTAARAPYCSFEIVRSNEHDGRVVVRIAGSTVLLTGVTGGIGGALAAELSARGARLVLTGRRPDALAPLAERYGARTIPADLADPDDVRRLAEEAAGTDILIA